MKNKGTVVLIILMVFALVAEGESMDIDAEDKLIYTISIWGQVKKPGEYRVEDGTDLVEAISKAGGATDYADLSKVKIIRMNEDKKETEIIDLEKLLDEDVKKLKIPELENGDVIYVSKNLKKGWVSFVNFVSQLAIIINVFYLIYNSSN